MAQNFLYMFEFVVDDLLITKPNVCAPEEYPTCCEISFRSSVFVSICDREFGQCVSPCSPKCGKCCLFSLESPVTDKDRLFIHIYKKKTDKCKFLVGATDIPIKPLFDKVTENFNIENPNWMEQLAQHTTRLPDPRTPSKTTVVDNDCDEDAMARREQMCPTSELTKRLLPLFNMKGSQTGNLVLIMRLVCNGPTIVSSFPFSKICAAACNQKSDTPINPPIEGCGGPCQIPDPCKKEEAAKQTCRRYFACNAEKACPCDECEDDFDRAEQMNNCKPKTKKKTKPCWLSSAAAPPPPSCSATDASKKPEKGKNMCQRFFSGGCDKSDAFDDTADECEAEIGSEESSEPCGEPPCCMAPCCVPPCFISPSKPDPGPEAYEEFEASLNGSGLTIRVLKDTHQVESVCDGTETFEDSGSECEKCVKRGPCETASEVLHRSEFARKHIQRHTAGNIINHPKLPKIRANIKYAGNECCPNSYHVPFSKIKQFSENQQNKVDSYRKGPLQHNDCSKNNGQRSCCLQVDAKDINKTLMDVGDDTRKKGIEVCYKTCEDTNTDVFLVKLGSKNRSQRKKNSIEIELKTPKQPLVLPIQKVTTETQITAAELDAIMSKGKKGKKGKGKKSKK